MELDPPAVGLEEIFVTKRKVAVVTVRSAGLGLATTRELTERGYDLALSSRNLQPAAERVRHEYDVQPAPSNRDIKTICDRLNGTPGKCLCDVT